jgi:hypothetical protein
MTWGGWDWAGFVYAVVGYAIGRGIVALWDRRKRKGGA